MYYWLRWGVMQELGRFLLVAGLVLAFTRLVVLLLGKLGSLPGDVVVRRDHVTIYVPIATSLLLSLLLTALL
jgi:hypothetical protein